MSAMGDGGLPETPVEDRGAFLAAGRFAQDRDGDLAVARQRFEAAYQRAADVGDVRAMAVAVLGIGGLWVHEDRTAAGWASLQTRLRGALAQVDPQSVLGVRLRARLAAESDYRHGRHAEILAVLDEARRLPDPEARAEVLNLAHHCLLGPGQGPLRRELADELVREAVASGRRSHLLMGLLWQTVDLFLDGDPHARRRLGELREHTARDDHLAVGFVVNAIDVMLALREGDFDRAEKLAARCHERGTAAGDVDATAWYCAQLVAIRWYQGRLPELLPLMEDLVHSPSLSVVDNACTAALAVAAAMTGDRRRAVGLLSALRGCDLEDLPRSSSWLVTMSGVVEAAHLLEDAETASRAYEILAPFGDLPAVVSLGVACFGSVHHALGLASLTTGDVDRAVDHLREAVQQNLGLEHWPAAAISRARYAQALALRAQPRDAPTVQLELAAADREATALGVALPGGVANKPGPLQAVCVRAGRSWHLALGPRTAVVEHSVGMMHLAVLIANPGQEIRALDLIAGVSALSGTAGASVRGEAVNLSVQSVLDPMAVKQYRRRLSELSGEMDELERRGDEESVAASRVERDWLLAELADATGIGSRPRRFVQSGERARVAATKAIRRAVAHVTEIDAVIGEHLATAVRTGTSCSYRL